MYSLSSNRVGWQWPNACKCSCIHHGSTSTLLHSLPTLAADSSTRHSSPVRAASFNDGHLVPTPPASPISPLHRPPQRHASGLGPVALLHEVRDGRSSPLRQDLLIFDECQATQSHCHSTSQLYPTPPTAFPSTVSNNRLRSSRVPERASSLSLLVNTNAAPIHGNTAGALQNLGGRLPQDLNHDSTDDGSGGSSAAPPRLTKTSSTRLTPVTPPLTVCTGKGSLAGKSAAAQPSPSALSGHQPTLPDSSPSSATLSSSGMERRGPKLSSWLEKARNRWTPLRKMAPTTSRCSYLQVCFYLF